MAALHALVEHCHGLVRAPNLHLHEVSLTMATSRAHCHGPVDVLPSIGAAEYVIDLLPSGVRSLDLGREYRLGVRAGHACEALGRRRAGGAAGCDYLQKRPVKGTEPHS